MAKAEGRILRAGNVKFQGRQTLGLTPDSPGAPTHHLSNPTQPPHVAIVQSNPKFTLIQVTCNCGQKMLLKCTNTPDQSIDPTPQQTPQQPMTDHEPHTQPKATTKPNEVEKQQSQINGDNKNET